MYFALSGLFLLAGPGRWSVDACLAGRQPALAGGSVAGRDLA